MNFALLALTLAAATASSEAAPADPPSAEVREQEEKKGIEALGVPLLGYNSDEKFGVGAAGGLYAYRPGTEPYALALAGQTYFTTGGTQAHFLRLDAPDPFKNGVRVESRLEFRHEGFAPYYGPGNDSSPEFENHFHGKERTARFSYDREAFTGWARVRLPELQRFKLRPWVGYAFSYVWNDAAKGSLLEEQKPVGYEGGAVGQVMLGLVHDSRDDEAAPRRGGSEEIAFRFASPQTGSRYTYANATITVRHFFPLSRRLVFAQRFVGDMLFGEVPFFELTNIGGSSPAEGLGGVSSVRGLPRDRFSGTTKLLSNSELRMTLLSPKVFGEKVDLGAVAFLDVGRAWMAGMNDGPLFNIHPAMGVGLRLTRREAVLRLDWGVSDHRSAMYMMFGHMF